MEIRKDGGRQGRNKGRQGGRQVERLVGEARKDLQGTNEWMDGRTNGLARTDGWKCSST